MFSSLFRYIGLVVDAMHTAGISKSQILYLADEDAVAFIRSTEARQAAATGLDELARIAGETLPIRANLFFLCALDPGNKDCVAARELIDCFGSGFTTWLHLERFMFALRRFVDVVRQTVNDRRADVLVQRVTDPSGQAA